MNRAEKWTIAGIVATYFLVYGSFSTWDSLWAFGPRYLEPIVALMMIPLAGWLANGTWRRWVLALALAIPGFWMQACTLLVNYSFVFWKYQMPVFRPDWRRTGEILWRWKGGQIWAHSRELLTGGDCVDFWLLNVKRLCGVGRMVEVMIPCVVLLVIGGLMIGREIRKSREFREA